MKTEKMRIGVEISIILWYNPFAGGMDDVFRGKRIYLQDHRRVPVHAAAAAVCHFAARRVCAELPSARDGAVWDAGPDRLLFLPPKIAYQQETDGEEIIAVHLEIPALRERTIETCAAPDGAAAAFEAMHRAWQNGQYYRCCGVLYDCLARVCTARPDAGGAADGGAHALDPALDAIRARYRDPDLDIPALAAQCGLSAPHFRRLFRRAYLMTPVQYLTRFRVAQAKNALAAGCSVADAAGRCGFRDPKYFSTVFHRVTGATPRAWQSDGTLG